MKVKVGDKVLVIAGKDKGKEGKVIKTYKKLDKVVVEGLNMVKKHSKPRTTEDKGGIFDIEAPIHVSNVAYLDPVQKKPTKIGYKVVDGKKVRYCKLSGTVINN